ncbi:conjugal transfer protein [Streptomyces pactum]|uniref:Conjugal transfer protein n=1 Tax=Streptomyces pactum TaxID=68249 RepID=A0ABS0NLS9_9ACTN|nr:conjugal transfer protein [Streptomyces pactum]MBH5336138.1 conjugal transfer protein [Streptomyces pactum]
MTDHNSSAGGVGGGPAPGHPASFGAPATAPQQRVPSDVARAQVAAAWVRSAPQAAVPPGQAAVPTLPPRDPGPRPDAETKQEKRERRRRERKAEYERKKAARAERAAGRKKSRGGASAPAADAAREETPGTRPGTGPGPGTAHTAPGAGTTDGRSAPAAEGGAPATAGNAAAGGTSGKAGKSGKAARVGKAAKGTSGKAFDVPAPGGRIATSGRRTHVALRATVLATTCLFALGSCTVMGLVIGKSGSTSTAALSQRDVDRYRLTSFPLDAAATFAEEYAMLCMTFSEKTEEERSAELARFVSAGVETNCGWTGSGSQTAESAAWDGSAEPIPEYAGHGRYLGVRVRLSTGQVAALTVPVYVRDLRTGQGLKVVGQVGVMPLPPGGKAPAIDEPVVDQALSDNLATRVLPGFFTAWGSSDATALARFTMPDATARATGGLHGAWGKPEITTAEALAPAGTRAGAAVRYRPGDTVLARVSVRWNGADGVGAVHSYRVTLENTAQGWFIKDVNGAVLDHKGGAAKVPETAPKDDKTTPPSATPGNLSGPDRTAGQPTKR